MQVTEGMASEEQSVARREKENSFGRKVILSLPYTYLEHVLTTDRAVMLFTQHPHLD